jgi:hypothetical protein
MDYKQESSWISWGIMILGYVIMALLVLASGDRQNKFDMRVIELERRLDALESK